MAEAAEVIVDTSDPSAPTEVRLDDAVPPKPEGMAPDAAISDLKRQMEESRAASERRLNEANRQIQEAAERASRAERQVVETQRSSVGTVLDSLTKDQDAIRRDMKAAYEASEFDRLSELQVKLSTVSARIVEAEKGKLALDEETRRPQTRQAQETLPIAEQMARAAASQGSPRSAAWLRSHSDLISSPQGQKTIETAHYYALGQGAEPDTDAYFHHIETKLGLRTQESPPEGRNVARAEEFKPPMAAPVTRNATNQPGRGTSDNVVRLSPTQREQALMDRDQLYPKMSDKDALTMYARNMRDLQNEGRI